VTGLKITETWAMGQRNGNGKRTQISNMKNQGGVDTEKGVYGRKVTAQRDRDGCTLTLTTKRAGVVKGHF